MKILRFLTLATCLALTGALSDMTVVVNRGENGSLSVKTPEMKDVNRVTLSRYDNGTQVLIFRYCSIKEKQSGCTAIDSDRLQLQLGSESVSVVILDARATDAGTRILEVIGNNRIEETFTVVFNASPPSDVNTVPIVVIVGVFFAVLITVVVTAVVSLYLYKRKTRRSLIPLTGPWIQKWRTLSQASLEQMNSTPMHPLRNTAW